MKESQFKKNERLRKERELKGKIRDLLNPTPGLANNTLFPTTAEAVRRHEKLEEFQRAEKLKEPKP